jgi:hypothetical protein
VIKSELSGDRQRGPGYGRIRFSGRAFDTTGLQFALKRNQGNEPFLGPGGVWQATETWHDPEDVTVEQDATVIAVGPKIVDQVVEQPANVALVLTLRANGVQDAGRLKVVQPLLGSGAAAGPDNDAELIEQQRRDEEERHREAEAARLLAEQEAAAAAAAAAAAEAERPGLEDVAVPSLTPAAAPASSEDRPATSRLPLVAAAVALLALIGGGAGAWFGCLIPGFGPASCAGSPAIEEAAGTPEVEEPLTCAGLTSGGECYAVAEKALAKGKLEPARQLFQQAATLGSLEASIAVARMYDPETWSAAASPAAGPNWETAVFWYEKAARQGDRAAQSSAGRLLCGNATSDIEKRQGRAYLEQAAGAGDDAARALLSGCS